MPSANSDSFNSCFSNLDSFIFLIWLLWLGFSVQCWIKLVQISILVLILEEMFLSFHHWVWGRFVIYCLYNIEVCSIYTYLVESFITNRGWILSKTCSASIEIEMIMWSFIYLFGQFIHGVHHIDWLAGTEPSLYPWDISHLTVIYGPFNILLYLVC